MARPIKEGLDYFPLDVDIFEDEKIEAIAGEFGPKGELAVIKLLCAIYKKGYFILWNDLTQATLLKRLPGASKEMINQIVNRLVLWGFFDEELFNSARVLTSENIQATYFEATKRRKLSKPSKYLINANSNSPNNEVNVDISTQIKGKESKVNKSKVNGRSVSSNLSQLIDFYENNFGKMPPLVLDDLNYAYNDYGYELTLEAMKRAVRQQKNFRTALNILDYWSRNGVKTLADAEAESKAFNQRKKQAVTEKAALPKAGKDIPSWSKPQSSKDRKYLTDEEVEAFINGLEDS
ncbi:Lin1244/Lin1753 domain-containing protein [Lactococcus lactis]|uniref:Lin1244/Lin1753 domain-containing protein n=1 Tax=Lactococcus lactis TaxID=1358 RepID=UPI001F58B753|nr:Lin1244/Lin1753 domain-containing protein [Lactococcus lactis]